MSTFTGNINLLVAAPMLQDALVDKDGTPMAAGTITCFHDNSRTTLKNWYYQSGTPGNYTYITLPNPLTLSAAGTICDINGVDTIPFFYPYDENDEDERDPYFIRIVNYAQTNQITRENFPFLGNQSGAITAENTFNNLITNGYFWRNIHPNTVSDNPPVSVGLQALLSVPQGGTNFACVVSPSQHDGFRMPDCQFQMNVSSGTDTVTFVPFSLGFGQPVNNAILPEYYLSHNCTNSGSGVTQKFYQFPVALHVNSLDSVPFTFSILAQNGASSGSNVMTVWLLQDTGTGGGTASRIEIGSITVSSSWQLYTITGLFNSSAGLNLGKGADDGWYLQIQMPLNTTSTLNFTKPSIYLTNNLIPSNDVQTYDQIGAIIDSTRTGDIRLSMNSFYPFGWLPMNNGFIGLSANGLPLSYARASSDMWPLYNLIWTFAKTYDTASNFNAISQMYINTGVAFTATNYGATAYSDFSANNALALTQAMGKVLIGTVPVSALLLGAYQQGVSSFSNSTGLMGTCSNGGFLYVGLAVAFTGTLPSNLQANAVYYVTNISGNTFHLATTYANAVAGTPIGFVDAGTPPFIINTHITGVGVGEYAFSQGSGGLPANIGQAGNYYNFFIKI